MDSKNFVSELKICIIPKIAWLHFCKKDKAAKGGSCCFVRGQQGETCCLQRLVPRHFPEA